MTSNFISGLRKLQFDNIAIGVLLIVATFNLCWAALNITGVVGEGAGIYFQILNFQQFVMKLDSLRWADNIWQIPGLIYSIFAENPKPLLGAQIINFSYILPLILSPIASYFILSSIGKTRYLVFQLLFLATGGLAAASFSVSVINAGACLFWPLFYIVQFQLYKFRNYFLIACTLLIYLFFNHEAALFLNFPLIYLLYKNEKGNQQQKGFWLLCFVVISLILQITMLANTISGYGKKHAFIFANEFAQFNGPWGVHLKLYSAFIFFLVFVSIFFRKLSNTKLREIFDIAFIVGIVGTCFWLFRPFSINVGEARAYRTLVMPTALLASIAAIVHLGLEKSQADSIALRFKFLFKILTIALIVANTNLYLGEIRWINDVEIFKISLNSLAKNSCGIVSPSIVMQNEKFLSVLLQSNSTVDRMLIAERYQCKTKLRELNNPCQTMINHEFRTGDCLFDPAVFSGKMIQIENFTSVTNL